MTEETIVAVYDTPAHAELAAQDLRASGVPDSAISLHVSDTAVAAAATMPARHEGFWSSLFGGEPDHDIAVYDRSLASGSTVVTVKVEEMHITRVMDILESHKPIDIDDRATDYGLTRTAAPVSMDAAVAPVSVPATTGASGSEVIQLAAESLAIGKRVVNRGTTRIRRFVVETPVEQDVSLHSERVLVERHPVHDGRPVTAANFTDKTIEVTETDEEAVVSKTARVVEEVSLHKEATDRVETVRDTVCKEEVEIEQIPSQATTTTTRGTAPKPGTPNI